MSVVLIFKTCPCAAKERRSPKAQVCPTNVLHGDGTRWHRRSAQRERLIVPNRSKLDQLDQCSSHVIVPQSAFSAQCGS